MLFVSSGQTLAHCPTLEHAAQKGGPTWAGIFGSVAEPRAKRFATSSERRSMSLSRSRFASLGSTSCLRDRRAFELLLVGEVEVVHDGDDDRLHRDLLVVEDETSPRAFLVHEDEVLRTRLRHVEGEERRALGRDPVERHGLADEELVLRQVLVLLRRGDAALDPAEDHDLVLLIVFFLGGACFSWKSIESTIPTRDASIGTMGRKNGITAS